MVLQIGTEWRSSYSYSLHRIHWLIDKLEESNNELQCTVVNTFGAENKQTYQPSLQVKCRQMYDLEAMASFY